MARVANWRYPRLKEGLAECGALTHSSVKKTSTVLLYGKGFVFLYLKKEKMGWALAEAGRSL